jgi:tripartite-type tricarboxylate transporter receptor subunit TctC
MVVPFGPGGTSDTIARLIVENLSDKIGRPRIVENRMGAGGNIAAYAVANADPDGATLLLAANHLTIAPSLYKKLNYDPLTDLIPVTLIGSTPFVVIANKDLQIGSLADLIALAKSKPGQLSYASPGLGTATHLAFEMLKQRAGIDVKHVPYRSNPLAMNDVISGQMPLFMDLVTTAAAHVTGGNVRGIVTTSAQRSPLLPDVPTTAEAGMPEFEASTWIAVFAPRGMPTELAMQLHNEISAALSLPAVRQRLESFGVHITVQGPDHLRALLKDDTAKWGSIIRSAGITQID